MSLILSSCGNNKDPENNKDTKVTKSSSKEDVKDSGSNLKEKESVSKTSFSKTITSKEVKSHIGDSLTVKGFIADIFLSEKVAYLNFENKFPKNVFSCVIFSADLNKFGDLSKYKGVNAEVTGKITTYKNKPQVILYSPDQIKIIK